MKKITIYLNNNTIAVHEIDKTNITIGRKTTNTITLDSTTVSGSHAIIHVIGDDCIFEDLGSTNGSFINNKQIKKHILQDKESITIGDFKLSFENPVEVEEEDDWQDDFEKTMILRPTSIAKQNNTPNQKITEHSTKQSNEVHKTLQPSNQNSNQNTNHSSNHNSNDDSLTRVISNGKILESNHEQEKTHNNVKDMSIPANKPIQSDVVQPQKTTNQNPSVKTESINVGNIQLLNGPAAGKSLALIKDFTTLGKPGAQSAAITKRSDGYYMVKSDGALNILINNTPIGNAPTKLNNHDIIDIVNGESNVRLEFYY